AAGLLQKRLAGSAPPAPVLRLRPWQQRGSPARGTVTAQHRQRGHRRPLPACAERECQRGIRLAAKSHAGPGQGPASAFESDRKLLARVKVKGRGLDAGPDGGSSFWIERGRLEKTREQCVLRPILGECRFFSTELVVLVSCVDIRLRSLSWLLHFP